MLLPNPANEIPGERTETSIQSELVDGRGKISIDRMLEARCGLQRGTTSVVICDIDPKSALWRATDDTDPRYGDVRLQAAITMVLPKL